MSLKFMNEAWSYPLNSHEKIVLLAVADCANDEGVAYPGYSFLCKKTGMARATLSKHLKVLKLCGILKSENHSEFGKGKKSNIYTISSRRELPYSSDSELMDKINNIRKETKSSKSSNVELPKVQNVDPKSSNVEHESFNINISNETIDSKKGSSKKFIKPTLDQVQDYIDEMGFTYEAQEFLDSNEQKGWVVGKARTPMKDWKAAMRVWQSNRKKWEKEDAKNKPRKSAGDINDDWFEGLKNM